LNVVDATVLADFLVGEPGFQRQAEKLMREDPDWITVGLWRYELGNVLWKMARFHGADAVKMRLNMESAPKLIVETVEEVDRPAVWDIAISTGLTVYDASYVWLARARGLKSRTRDKEVLRECSDVAHSMPVV